MTDEELVVLSISWADDGAMRRSILQDLRRIVAETEQRVAREAAEVCDEQGRLYRENAIACSKNDSPQGEINDINGALACEGCTAAIRAHFGHFGLDPKPTAEGE